MPTSENRTKWPVQGGAVSFQPGWFQGHSRAQIYINIGLGTVPPNMSHPMITPFEIVGPDNDPYPGTICIPQVKLPAGIEVQVGDNATIQVIELAQHGAALYNASHALSFP
jgi:capsular polysaccharide biosynthesis protein